MTTSDLIVYLDGAYVPVSEACVSIDDRGFTFADACYEVTAFIDGRFVALDRHLARLQRGLDAIQIDFSAESLAPIHDELIERNGLKQEPIASVYVQVTRGVAPRSHGFPAAPTPTVLVRAQPIARIAARRIEIGSSAITRPDQRWGRVDIKTTGLLPNVLAEQAAIEAGVDDVIQHRDGLVTEGSHSNVFAVIDSALVTAPADHRILAGVTRGIVLELAHGQNIDVIEREWSLDELVGADEVLMTSTTAGVRPIIEIDGRPVGSGARGPIVDKLIGAYTAFVTGERLG